MKRPMTLFAQRYEIEQIIFAAMAPKSQMMHFQIPVAPAHLASPTVPAQCPLADLRIFRDFILIL
jgi:hypothetical protein